MPPTPLPEFRFRIPTLAEVFHTPIPPLKWVLPRRLAVGDIAILGGPAYSGKSWVMAELAIAWAAGLSALDWAPAYQKQRVLWLDEENSHEEAWTRIRAIQQARELDPSELKDTLLFPLPRSGFSFSRPSAHRAMLKLVEDFKPDWVLVDSLVGVLRLQDENSATQLRNVYNDFFKPLSVEYKTGLLFLHHTRKRAAELAGATVDYRDPEMLRGSGDILASADTILTSWRSEGRTTIHTAKVRRDPEHGEDPPADLVLSLIQANGGRRPVVEAQKPIGRQTSLSVGQAILSALEGVTAPLAAQELIARLRLAGHVSFSKSAFYAALTSLEARGQVVCDAQGGEKVVKLSGQAPDKQSE